VNVAEDEVPESLGALVCFDVDGTLETSAGPVTVEQLRRLEAAGVAVAIVSPSPARPPGFPEFISGPTGMRTSPPRSPRSPRRCGST
jgi:hypothetical protein